MANRPPPKEPTERRRRNVPDLGEMTATPGVGWQHGKVPPAPTGMKPASVTAWKTWMGAWFAAHWTPEDLPGLRMLVLLYDQVERGEYQRAGELRLQMDTYGITPKGQQDRRWKKPEAPVAPPSSGDGQPGKRYGHLRTA